MKALHSAVSRISIGSIADWELFFLGLFLFIAGVIVLRVVIRLIMRSVARRFREQSRELLRKSLLYSGTALLFVVILNATGVSIGGLLGAAGIVGIAIGIASQTSLSNVISGLFLVSERFLEIGEIVRIDENTGTVFSIDLLSIKLKTFDNVIVRIPNQNLIERTITNITRFPIRRLDFLITVPVTQSLTASIDALREAGTQCPLVMEEPEPLVLIREQTSHGWSILLGVWFERQQFVAVRNEISIGMQDVFKRRGLRIQTAVVRIERDDSAASLHWA